MRWIPMALVPASAMLLSPLGLLATLGLSSAAVVADPSPASTLVLEARAALRAGGVLHVQATFRNGGAQPLTFFVPEHFGVENFPAWRFVRSDGVAFVPYAAPYQSMWTEGDQGTLVRLAPQRTWSVEHDLTLFLRESAGSDAHLTPLPLDPGTYRVECSHEQRDDTIPVGGPGFRTSRRRVQGLWTGRIEAPPVAIAVSGPRVVSLRIDAPRDLEPGKPYALVITLRNDTGYLASVPGALTISASSKPNGTYTSRVLLLDPPRPAAAEEVQTIGMGVDATLTWTVNLTDLAFTGGRSGAAPGILAEALGQGIFHLSASFGGGQDDDEDDGQDDDGILDVDGRPKTGPLVSNGLWRYVVLAPSASRVR